MKFKYIGETEKVFPTLGITVKNGDEFEAPDNFVAVNVVHVNSGKAHSPKHHKAKEDVESFVADKTEEEITTDMSAPSDKTLGE